MADREEIEGKARILGGVAYPNGDSWQCMACDYTCGDDGPDYCPNDNSPLTRQVLGFPRNPAS